MTIMARWRHFLLFVRGWLPVCVRVLKCKWINVCEYEASVYVTFGSGHCMQFPFAFFPSSSFSSFFTFLSLHFSPCNWTEHTMHKCPNSCCLVYMLPTCIISWQVLFSLSVSLFLSALIFIQLKRIVADAHTDAVVVTATNVIATSCRIRFSSRICRTEHALNTHYTESNHFQFILCSTIHAIEIKLFGNRRIDMIFGRT